MATYEKLRAFMTRLVSRPPYEGWFGPFSFDGNEESGEIEMSFARRDGTLKMLGVIPISLLGSEDFERRIVALIDCAYREMAGHWELLSAVDGSVGDVAIRPLWRRRVAAVIGFLAWCGGIWGYCFLVG